MSATMIEELGKAQKAGESDARAKYRELLLRRNEPEPGDGVALAAALNTLKLTEADFTADGRRLDEAAGHRDQSQAVVAVGRRSRETADRAEAARPELLAIAGDLLAALDAKQLLAAVEGLPIARADDKARAARERFAAVGRPLLDAMRQSDATAAAALRGAERAADELSLAQARAPRPWIFERS
jgi:hypothetical protein